MQLESTKIIILGITLILLLYQFLFQRLKIKRQFFILSSTIITLLLISIMVLKLHHILRDEFNISNTITYSVCSIPFVYHFYKFRDEIQRSDFILLFLSLVFIGLGLLLDLLTDGKIISFASSDFVEEILRILGALFWLLYYIFYSFRVNRN